MTPLALETEEKMLKMFYFQWGNAEKELFEEHWSGQICIYLNPAGNISKTLQASGRQLWVKVDMKIFVEC